MNNTHQKLQDIDRTVTAYEKESDRLRATLDWYEKEILKHERQRMEIIIQTNTAYGKNVNTSPERDKKGCDSLHDLAYSLHPTHDYTKQGHVMVSRKDDPTWADLDYGIKEIWRKDARAALEAADAVCCTHPKCPGGSLCCCQTDAVVTEEMISETILKALVFTNENSEAWADGLARDIAALFRGDVK